MAAIFNNDICLSRIDTVDKSGNKDCWYISCSGGHSAGILSLTSLTLRSYTRTAASQIVGKRYSTILQKRVPNYIKCGEGLKRP